MNVQCEYFCLAVRNLRKFTRITPTRVRETERIIFWWVGEKERDIPGVEFPDVGDQKWLH